MKNPKFVLTKGKSDKYYFRLTAKNGETILQSQGYAAKSGCSNGIESVKTNAPHDDRYERKDAKDGQFYFNLLAANKQVIGTSEMYKSKASRENGIESVKTNAPVAGVEDLTSA